ncbi:hypothetical protein G3480_13170 [Thiorhodococcus mannitoliphagus]|uniref:Lipoprotein n=1 Tax=Thiorhodococcus mannitoliphagus TaxID=329406 RepID=A0A6P1DZV2_9GAMM|nr:hypothetical protein [Thiorhodococcus mannitoliphagus]NEX21254.1 hypothetical protein [Thiorhodococcus mannitoliphagus]
MIRTSLQTRLDRLFPAIFLVALLAGCQTPPAQDTAASATTADSACVAACDLKKSQCESRQKLRLQDCEAYRSSTDGGKENCLARFGSHCVEPAECLAPDLSICQSQLEGCLSECPAQTDAPPLLGRGEALSIDTQEDPGADAPK